MNCPTKGVGNASLSGRTAVTTLCNIEVFGKQVKFLGGNVRRHHHEEGTSCLGRGIWEEFRWPV